MSTCGCRTQFKSKSCQQGFSLFELCLVLIVISVLIYSGYDYYLRTIEDSKTSLIKFQAATFSRTVTNLYGQAKIESVRKLKVMDATIYLNEKGWPASADKRSSFKSYNQSPEECELLWHGLFKNAPGTVIALPEVDRTQINKSDFSVSSINGRICRYELNSKTEERYFFDYHLSSGTVKVFSP